MNEIEFITNLNAPLKTHLTFDEFPACVEVNDERIHEAVRRYFSPFLSDESPNPTRIVGFQGEPVYDVELLLDVPRPTSLPKAAFYHRDDALVIYKKRSGVVDYVYNDDFYVVGDILRYPQQLFNVVGLAFMHALRRQNRVSIHASAAAMDGKGYAFAGPSGSGKSTTGLSMLERGFDFVSNDRISLWNDDGNVSMVGVPKWPRVNPGTLLAIDHLTGLITDEDLERYKRLPSADLWGLEEKHDVYVERIYGRKRTALRTRLERLYVLSWTRDGGPFEMHTVPENEAGYLLQPLVKTELTDPPDLPQPSNADLSRLMQGVEVIQVTGGINVEGLMDRIAASTSPVIA
jgi:HprK-related kinase B